MKHEVVFQRSAQKELASLHGQLQLRIAHAIRLLYTIDHQKKIVTIYAIGHRREVYR
jgi:mRNA-degrading endonuclease RelE of RelBE toxin-antitoxin system